MHGLLKSAFVYTLANMASAAVPFLLMPVLTRAMPPDEYGQIAMFTTLVTIATAIVGLSVHGSVSVRFFDKSTSDFDIYVSSCLAVMLCSFIGAAAGVMLIVTLWPDALGLPLQWALAAVVAAAASFVMQLRLVVWLAQKRAVHFASLQMTYALLNAGLTTGMLLTLHSAAAGRMGAQTLALVFAAAIATISLVRSRMLSPRISLTHMRDGIRFGAPLVPHLLGATVLVTFDRFIIKENLGLAETGVYMVAVQIALALSLIADAVNKAFVPWLYEQLAAERPEFKPWIVKRTWLLFGMIAILTVAAIMLADFLVWLIAGEKYVAAATVLPWLIGGQALGAAYFLVANYIFYSQRTHYLAFSSLLSGLVNVILTLFLVPRLGIVGAGISFCVAQALLFLVVWWYANLVYPLPWLFWRRQKKKLRT